MSVFNPMPFVNEIKMRINLHKMKRLFIAKGINAGNIHRMIATKNHRHCASGKNGTNPCFNIGMAVNGIRVNDIGVTNINNANLIGLKIGNIIFMVISTRMAERK